MKANYDSEVIFCNFCNEPIFPMEARTIDLNNGNRYCNPYCCDMDKQKDLKEGDEK